MRTILLDYLQSHLGDGVPHRTSKGLQYSFMCTLCNDHKDRLFVNMDRQVFICHHCETAGTVITLISLLEGVDWKKSLDIYRDMEGYEKPLPEDLEREVYERLFKVEAREAPRMVYPLPEEFTLIENATGKIGKRAVDYLRSRGITSRMCERYYIGYCPVGKYANRIIMPDFEDGDLIYWQARTFLPTPANPVLKKMFRKVLNPSLTKEQIEDGLQMVDKSEVISNIDFIREYGMAVLCEGKMDSYTIGDLGGCLHGKVMSDAQFIKLVANKDKIGTIAVMLDGDALKNAITIADRLYRHFDDVRICRIEDKKADPNTIGRKEVLRLIQEALTYSPSFTIKAKLKGWTH